MSVNQFFNRNVIRATEVFTAGKCNLKCRYCYIPKTKFLHKVHADILERVKAGTYIDDLERIFGKELESISHWGTEPTLTIHKWHDFYKQVAEKFPNLKEVFASSNFMTPPSHLITFVNDVLKPLPRLTVRLQISLDGPEWITDTNRRGGSTKQIVNNVKEVLSNLDTHHKVRANVKPTSSMDQWKEYVNLEVIEDYYNFFDEVMTDWKNNMTSCVELQRSVNPTLVMPYDFTIEDGKRFTKTYENQIKLQETKKYKAISPPESSYYIRWAGKAPFYREWATNHHMFTCSAGDSSLGLTQKVGGLGICHRAYYVDYPEYEDEVRKWVPDPETLASIETGKNDIMKDISIANYDNKKQLLKMLYANRAHHDFQKHKTTSDVALIYELASAGQISRVYKNHKLAELLARFTKVTCCHLDNIAVTGMYDNSPAGYYRLFGNGTFELILKRWKNYVR